MIDRIVGWNLWGGEYTAYMLSIGLILLIASVVGISLRLVVVRIIAALAIKTQAKWDETMVRCGVFNYLAAIIPGIVVHNLSGAWLVQNGEIVAAGQVLMSGSNIWILFFSLLAFHSLLNGLVEIYNKLPFSHQLPIRSFAQVLKLIAVLVFLIVSVSMLMGRSPALLVSGLGAMTAVLMLVFKDPILGFVAGIQLSANRMLAVGDWLEMPKYNADGDVIDITLTTVKVRNWDQTITTVPTYALIADSFKNWRGIQEIGGRRMMRSIYIDMNTIKFLTPEDVGRLRKAQLVCDYLDEKLAQIEEHNRLHNIDPESAVNGRKLTNIGTFRAYLLAYLKSHPGIHQNLITMVRQLQPGATGLPIQIYAFTSDTAWVAHEGVQSDIFDHIFAVAGEFGLRVFQEPSGQDLNRIISSVSSK